MVAEVHTLLKRGSESVVASSERVEGFPKPWCWERHRLGTQYSTVFVFILPAKLTSRNLVTLKETHIRSGGQIAVVGLGYSSAGSRIAPEQDSTSSSF